MGRRVTEREVQATKVNFMWEIVTEREVHASKVNLSGTKVKIMWMHATKLEMKTGVLFMQVYLRVVTCKRKGRGEEAIFRESQKTENGLI